MLDNNANVKCPWCLNVSNLKAWDDNTYKQCINREQRRAFKSLTTFSVWGTKSKNFYRCPSCDQWSRGNKLMVVDKDGNMVNGLGGSDLFEVNE